MKFNIDNNQLAELIERVELDLDNDTRDGNFGEDSGVSWLSTAPESVTDYVDNIFDRLDTVGVSLNIDREDAEEFGDSLSLAHLCRTKGWTGDFDKSKIDQKKIGDAAYYRSDYRKAEAK